MEQLKLGRIVSTPLPSNICISSSPRGVNHLNLFPFNRFTQYNTNSKGYPAAHLAEDTYNGKLQLMKSTECKCVCVILVYHSLE